MLVWQRQNWNVLYPHVDIDEAELNDLKSMSTYVAGFTDPAVESRAELYDVFVNGKKRRIVLLEERSK